MAQEYRVWFDPENTGVFADDRDLTPYLESADWKIGRDSPKTLEGVNDPGVLVMTLFNWDDRFDTGNPDSPYHFSSPTPLLRYVTLIVEQRTAGVAQLQWTRQATMKLWSVIPVNYGSGLKIAKLTAYGIFAVLNTVNARIALDPTVPTEQSVAGTGEFVRRILSQVLGNPSSSRDTEDWLLDEGLTRLAHSYLYNRGVVGSHINPQPALGGLRYLEKVEIGRLLELRDGRIAFRDRRWRWSRRGAPIARISDQPGAGEFNVERIEPRDSRDDVYNRITVETSVIQVSPEQELWQAVGVAPLEIAPMGGRVLIDVEVNVPLGGQGEVSEVLNWRPPVLATESNWADGPDVVISALQPTPDIITGSTAASNWQPNDDEVGQMTGEVGGDRRRVDVLPLATAGQVRLELDDGQEPVRFIATNLTANPLYLWYARVRGVVALVYDRTEDTIQSDESVRIYGLEEWQYPVEILRPADAGDEGERAREQARDHLRMLLLVYQQPRQHLVVSFHANSGTAQEQASLAVGPDDLVAVTDAAEGLTDELYWVEYVQHRVTGDGDHLVEWGLADAFTVTPWATLGESWWEQQTDGSIAPGQFHRVGF